MFKGRHFERTRRYSVQGRVAAALRTIAEATALGVSDADMESAHAHAGPGKTDGMAAYTAVVCGAEYAWLRSTRTAGGIAAACAREWSRSEEHHRAAIHHADKARARIFQPVSREWYAVMLAARGDVDRARPMLAEALALYETIGMPATRAARASGSPPWPGRPR